MVPEKQRPLVDIAAEVMAERRQVRVTRSSATSVTDRPRLSLAARR
jgi:hypothetical protein